MGVKGSMKYQITQKLHTLKKFGQSKHQAKLAEKARCAAAGEKYNPARVPGIFSHTTADTYRTETVKFGEWVKQHGVRHMDQVRPEHVKEYLQKEQQAGKSAWSLHTMASAITKIFEIEREKFTTELGWQLPARRSESIVRSRVPVQMDRHFSVEKNKEIINFGKGTGLRKNKELRELRPEQIKPDGTKIFQVLGKGGRYRTVPVVSEYQAHVRAMREKAIAEGRDRVFEAVPKNMDQHGYRREYAQTRYKELEKVGGYATGEQYRVRDGSGRVFDRGILQEVSKNLGHNRIDVAVTNYIK